MNSSQIEEMEYAYFESCSKVKQKHNPLEARLKELLEKLSLTFNSSIKYEITQEMAAIQAQIKLDNEQLARQKEALERMKSELRKAYYEKEAKKARDKEARIRSILNPYSDLHRNVGINHKNKINYQDWRDLLNILQDDSFLELVELVETNSVNIAFLSSYFLTLYAVWKKLDYLEKDVKSCLDLFND